MSPFETTSVIGNAVNARFHTYDRGNKRGVAEPKTQILWNC